VVSDHGDASDSESGFYLSVGCTSKDHLVDLFSRLMFAEHAGHSISLPSKESSKHSNGNGHLISYAKLAVLMI